MSVSIRGQFRRSVHLTRDVYGDGTHEGYVVTGKARELLVRVADALGAPVAQRAWSVTGPYGGGKSAFALFLSGLLRGDPAARARLDAAAPELAARLGEARGGPFCPVLVVGSREPLAPALLRGLADGLDAFVAHHAGDDDLHDRLGALAEEARATAPEGGAVLDLVERAAVAVHDATGGGLLLVVDELGKTLEHAALYPGTTDLFVLQQLAERASRAGAPLLVFTILHQAFDRYAGRLGGTQRDEWRKVQGRFEDVAFVVPVEETLRLLAEAVELDPAARLAEDPDALVERVVGLAELPAGADAEAVRQHLGAALPLHPAVALLVGPLFRRLAQNERSLFAFLSSGEPHGFLDVVGRPAKTSPGLFDADLVPLYRLDDLYDYLVANVGATLFSARMERLWAETESVLATLRAPGPLAVRLVKHAALLGFAGRLAGLRPTAETLAATAGASLEDTREALDALREAQALTFRPFGETYHVWQGSTFDLEAALRDAREQVPQRTPLADLLRRAVPPRPLVARRHSYRTGTPRVFDVAYASDADALDVARAPLRRADGRVIYVLPEHDGDREALVERLREADLGPTVLVAVPDGVASLREAVRDLACLDWVRDHAEALRGDAAARREVAQQRVGLAAEVERRLEALLRADEAGRNPCTWILGETTFRLGGRRALQSRLSALFDDVFAEAPEIWNELLNHSKPSPSAVRGLKLLLDAMLHRGAQPRLGIEGTPAEYGMYASVLRQTGLHRETADGWAFARPDPAERPGCAAVWDAIADLLRTADGQPVPVRELYARLAAPPHGVRPGLIPVFLIAFAVHARDEVAFYENGSFVRDLSFETVERLLKSAERGQEAFTVQWTRIEGARAALLATLAPLLGLPGSVDQPLPLAVRLLRHVHELPPFVRRTATLSARTTAVREALQRATDPTALLFESLPEACGAGPLGSGEDAGQAEAFGARLQEALRELGGAYDALLADVEGEVARAFRLHATETDARRHELAERARTLLPAATDLGLKAFLVRATDEMLDARGWLESLAALLARRPPAQWSDEDRAAFAGALRQTAAAFYRLEPLAYDLAAEHAGRPPDEKAPAVRRVRLFVQTLNEAERDGVIHVHPEDDALVDDLYRAMADAVRRSDINPDVQLAALSRLAADLLGERTSDPTRQPHE